MLPLVQASMDWFALAAVLLAVWWVGSINSGYGINLKLKPSVQTLYIIDSLAGEGVAEKQKDYGLRLFLLLKGGMQKFWFARQERR